MAIKDRFKDFNKLAIFGATLQDIGTSLRGENPSALMNLAQMVQEKPEERLYDAWAKQLEAQLGTRQGEQLPPDISSVGADVVPEGVVGVPSLTQETPESFNTFLQNLQTPPDLALRPEFGTIGKKFAGISPIAMKNYETALGVKGQVASQEMKESEKKQRDFRRVALKLDQSADILARAYQTTVEALKNSGIPFRPQRGIGGRLFGIAQQVMSTAGYNEFVKTYKGNLNEAAIALMRMAMPGRSERMVNLYKQTLPDLTGNPYEDISQIAESMTAAYGDALATLKDKKGKPKYDIKTARKLRNAFKEDAYTDIANIFVKAGILTPEEANSMRATSTLPGLKETGNASDPLGIR
ncbi:MAG: hypothetical protein ACTSUF_10290 [Candidatus Heimdallarchaeaceae archaeon]